MKITIHAVAPQSRANGPGQRFVVWTQGCSRGCAGCFNPLTLDPAAGTVTTTAQLADVVAHNRQQIEGITLSGGEPLEQPAAVLDFLQRIAAMHLSVVLFSGCTLAEIQNQPLGPEILRHVDILVAGPFVQSRPAKEPLLGSANQTVHFLSNRYEVKDLAGVPRLEIRLAADGSLIMSGMQSLSRNHE